VPAMGASSTFEVSLCEPIFIKILT